VKMEEYQPTVHVSIGPVGHSPSADCWCEPPTFMWIENVHGVIVRVVQHEDATHTHHQSILHARDHCRNEEYHNDPEAGWITRLLDNLGRPPKLLPPPPPKES
jgi:hypothetical protein